MRFLDLIFLHGAGCLGTLDPHSRDSLGNQHHAEKLSPRIALHFSKVRKLINATIVAVPYEVKSDARKVGHNGLK